MSNDPNGGGEPSFLPPEIWIEIFGYATDVPGIMDTSIPNPFTTDPSYDITDDSVIDTSIKASTRTKSSIALVCKEWNSMAMPIMVRCISLHSRRALHSLEDTLLDPASTYSIHKLGRHTRHLRVYLHDGDISGTHASDGGDGYAIYLKIFASISHIFHSFPCLEIYSQRIAITVGARSLPLPSIMPFTSAVPAFVVDALGDSCGSSLKMLCIPHGNKHDLSFLHLYSLIKRVPNLQTLSFTTAGLIDACPLTLPLHHLPRLRFLSIASNTCPPEQAAHVVTSPLPNLREISLGGVHDTVSHFLRLQGPFLTIIHYYSQGEPSLDQSRFDLVRECCPNLLYFIVNGYLPSEATLDALPHIAPYIGLHLSEVVMAGKKYAGPLLHLWAETARKERSGDATVKLKVVRILYPDLDKEVIAWLRLVAPKQLKEPLRMEDRLGRSLT